MWRYSLDRFKEPSTWAGLAGVLQGLKVVLPAQHHQLLDGLTMAAGAIAASKADPGKP